MANHSSVEATNTLTQRFHTSNTKESYSMCCGDCGDGTTFW